MYFTFFADSEVCFFLIPNMYVICIFQSPAAVVFRDCSLNHKIPLKELRQSLKCFEEGKVTTSSFDNFADGPLIAGKESEFQELPWIPFAQPCAVALVCVPICKGTYAGRQSPLNIVSK